MSAVIRRRDGFTNSLYKKAENAQGRLVLNALVEGPYGGLHDLSSYGTVMIFAGGVGITHQLPYIRHLVSGFANGTVATRRVTLVWIIQTPEHLEWIRPWMTSILALDRRREILRIQLFVTRPRSTREIHSPSATVQMFPGRPNVDTLIEMESRGQIGAMGVSVCGTGGLADDVRRAVRRRGERNVDFVQESYSW
jgi:predicted ferric reductase